MSGREMSDREKERYGEWWRNMQNGRDKWRMVEKHVEWCETWRMVEKNGEWWRVMENGGETWRDERHEEMDIWRGMKGWIGMEGWRDFEY